MKTMRFFLLVCVTAAALMAGFCTAADRTEVAIPDLPGYVTLKCDFHMHTVFSDGKVWPTVRVDEAWREGLDAIAITDHLEYSPHKSDVKPDVNRAYEIARADAERVGLILIRGAEITRDMPPGHFNAIFIKDAGPLNTKEWPDAMKAAIEQGAFLFWNHPGWTGQQPDGVPRWYDEHTELLEKGWMKGVEVVNEGEYYPLVQKWAMEKHLTMLGNSDVHDPVNLAYDMCAGEHRAMTLVFAKERSAEAIKEALLARRTAVYYKNMLIGEEKYLKPLFEKSIDVQNPEVSVKGKGRAYVRIHNNSQVDFELAGDGSVEEVWSSNNLVLRGGKTVMLTIGGQQETLSGRRKLKLPYVVKNLLVGPEQGMHVELPLLTVEFEPTKGN